MNPFFRSAIAGAFVFVSLYANAQDGKVRLVPLPSVQKRLIEVGKRPLAERSADYQRAAQEALRSKDYVGYDAATTDVRDTELALHRFNEVKNYLLDQIEAGTKAKDILWQATAVEILGGYLQMRKDAEDAVSCFERALELREQAHDSVGAAESLTDLGLIFTQLGSEEKALPFYEKALPIQRAIGDRAGEALTMNNLGSISADLGRPEKALEYYEKVVPILKDLGDEKDEATTLTNIGSIYSNLDQPRKALEYNEKALAIQSRVGDKIGEATTLNNLGFIYSKLGQTQKALEYYEKTLPLRVEANDKRGEAITFNNLGTLSEELKKPKQALEFYQKALDIKGAVGSRSWEAAVLSNVGGILSNQGQPSQALEFYEKALAIEKDLGDRAAEGTTLNNEGMAYADLGQLQKALERYEESLPIQRQIGDRNGEAISLMNIGGAFHDLHSPALAIAFGKNSINVSQTLRVDAKGLGKEIETGFAATFSKRYRLLADWLAEEGRLSEAEEVLDLLKDQEFFGFIRRSAGSGADTVDLTSRESEWVKQYDALGDNLAKVASERDQILKLKPEDRTSAQAARLVETRKQADALAKAFEAFLTNVKDAFSAANADKDRLTDLKDAKRLEATLSALPNHPAALYTLETSDGVRVILSIPGLTEPKRSDKSKVTLAELNRKILAFRETLTDRRLDPRPVGAELYDLLVRPVEKDLEQAGVQTLMWSLDGTLRYVPMWALYDSQTKKFLIEKYPSSLFTPRTVDMLVADTHAWTAAEFGITQGGKVGDVSFAALPGVAHELAGVHDALGGPAPVLDDGFTEDAFRSALEAGPRVMHVATHFRFRTGDDKGSYLLLGKGQTLTVEEMKGLPGDTFRSLDLLVLSACETAMGGEADGSEFESFSLLAQQDGAGAVLATLWPVADDSTALLMSEFYRLRKLHPEWTKLEALRQTQLSMLKGTNAGGSGPARSVPGGGGLSPAKGAPLWPSDLPKYAHPYFWAPFVLTGNWK